MKDAVWLVNQWTRRNNNVILTSKRHYEVIITSCICLETIAFVYHDPILHIHRILILGRISLCRPHAMSIEGHNAQIRPTVNGLSVISWIIHCKFYRLVVFCVSGRGTCGCSMVHHGEGEISGWRGVLLSIHILETRCLAWLRNHGPENIIVCIQLAAFFLHWSFLRCIIYPRPHWPLLLTWFNFSPSMDTWLHPL